MCYLSAMTRRPTIHDVARAAGVSITTVSHALNEKGHVAAKTRERVIECAQRLGYFANPLARGLRERSLRVLGLVIRPFEQLSTHQPDGVDYFARLVGETSSRALDHGYSMMLLGSRHDPIENSLVMAFDGYVINQPIRNDPLLAELVRRRIPAVTLGRDLANPGYEHAIDDQDYAMSALLMEHLSALGMRTLWYIGGTAQDSWNADVERAIAECASKTRTVVKRRHVPEGDGVEGGYQSIRELLATEQQPPDAVLCLTGRQGGGAEQALLEAGIRIPDQVMVATCIDAEQCRQAPVPITTVSNSARDVARAAVDRVVALANQEPYRPFEFSSELLLRESTRR